MRRTFTPLPILEREGVVIQSTGADTWRCKCPVHGGDGPSMAIRLRDGAWRLTCFACGFNGTAIGLVMALRQCDAREAVRVLGGDEVYEPAPVRMHIAECIVVACDVAGCGNRVHAEQRTYKVIGSCGSLWTTTAVEETVFHAPGWEAASDACAHVCAECIARSDARKFNRVSGRTTDLSTGITQ